MQRTILITAVALVVALVLASPALAEGSVEGESFTHPTGTSVDSSSSYSGGQALKISNNTATATKQITLTQASTVVVKARAGFSGSYPSLSILVNGTVVGTKVINSSTLQDYAYTEITLQPGTYTIGLQGSNVGTGRNIYVDVVSFPSLPDTTPPETTITSGPSGSVSQNWANFSFISSESGSTFECSLDGATFVPCTSPQSYANLVEGAHTFQVRAIDAAGNVDPTPATRNFTTDTTGPTSLSIDSGPEGTVNTSSVTFTFSSQDPDTVRYGCLLQQVYSDGSVSGGTYSDCTSPQTYSGLTDGNYRFWVAAYDGTGNLREVRRDFSVDAPIDTIIDSGPAEGEVISDNTPTFTFHAINGQTDATNPFQCSLTGPIGAGGGVVTDTVSCNSPYTYPTALPDGDYTFTVEAVDHVLRHDPTPAVRHFTVDTTPDTFITADSFPDEGGTTTGNAVFRFDSDDPSVFTYACRLIRPNDPNPQFNMCTSPGNGEQDYFGLPDGSYRFEVAAAAPSGSTDPTPAFRNFTVDTTP